MEACRPTYIPLDDRIPFLEGFIVPYMLWFPMLLALGLYLARYDHEGFKRYMTYVGVAFFTVIALYLLFPNRQDLRVTQFPRDNLFTRLVALVYSQDTNTNVCPSLHVVGSMAVCFAAWNCRRLRKPWMQGAIWAFAFLVGGVHGVCEAALRPGPHPGRPLQPGGLPRGLPVDFPPVRRGIPCETFCQRACDLTAGSLWAR